LKDISLSEQEMKTLYETIEYDPEAALEETSLPPEVIIYFL